MSNHDDLTQVTMALCGAQSKQGTICIREKDHGGCHEGIRDDDLSRWWGDARWAPWEWIVYEFENLDPDRPQG